MILLISEKRKKVKRRTKCLPSPPTIPIVGSCHKGDYLHVEVNKSLPFHFCCSALFNGPQLHCSRSRWCDVQYMYWASTFRDSYRIFGLLGGRWGYLILPLNTHSPFMCSYKSELDTAGECLILMMEQNSKEVMGSTCILIIVAYVLYVWLNHTHSGLQYEYL